MNQQTIDSYLNHLLEILSFYYETHHEYVAPLYLLNYAKEGGLTIAYLEEEPRPTDLVKVVGELNPNVILSKKMIKSLLEIDPKVNRFIPKGYNYAAIKFNQERVSLDIWSTCHSGYMVDSITEDKFIKSGNSTRYSLEVQNYATMLLVEQLCSIPKDILNRNYGRICSAILSMIAGGNYPSSTYAYAKLEAELLDFKDGYIFDPLAGFGTIISLLPTPQKYRGVATNAIARQAMVTIFAGHNVFGDPLLKFRERKEWCRNKKAKFDYILCNSLSAPRSRMSNLEWCLNNIVSHDSLTPEGKFFAYTFGRELKQLLKKEKWQDYLIHEDRLETIVKLPDDGIALTVLNGGKSNAGYVRIIEIDWTTIDLHKPFAEVFESEGKYVKTEDLLEKNQLPAKKGYTAISLKDVLIPCRFSNVRSPKYKKIIDSSQWPPQNQNMSRSIISEGNNNNARLALEGGFCLDGTALLLSHSKQYGWVSRLYIGNEPCFFKGKLAFHINLEKVDPVYLLNELRQSYCHNLDFLSNGDDPTQESIIEQLYSINIYIPEGKDSLLEQEKESYYLCNPRCLPGGYHVTTDESDYQIIRCLGMGGFGNTYEAIWTDKTAVKPIPLKVALKEFYIDRICSRDDMTMRIIPRISDGTHELDSAREHFIKESRIMKQLSSKSDSHIVRIYESIPYCEETNTGYYSMELIENGSLQSFYDEGGRFDESAAIEKIIIPIGNALRLMHEGIDTKMIHFDVKPANIMLNSDGEGILIDFGSVKRYDFEGEVTHYSTCVTSRGFAPPELYADEEAVWNFHPEIDVYSLAATLYYMLTVEIPKPLSATEKESFIEENKSRFSKKVASALAEALQSDPGQRTSSVDEFIAQLTNMSDMV